VQTDTPEDKQRDLLVETAGGGNGDAVVMAGDRQSTSRVPVEDHHQSVVSSSSASGTQPQTPPGVSASSSAVQLAAYVPLPPLLDCRDNISPYTAVDKA